MPDVPRKFNESDEPKPGPHAVGILIQRIEDLPNRIKIQRIVRHADGRLSLQVTLIKGNLENGEPQEILEEERELPLSSLELEIC